MGNLNEKRCKINYKILYIWIFVKVITIFLFLYLLFKISNLREGFDDTSDVKTDINQIYNADIEAIWNLSSITTQLIAGWIIVPGNLVANDTLGVSNNRIEGGRGSIRNPNKIAKGQTKDWSIWNMTGTCGDIPETVKMMDMYLIFMIMVI